MHADTSVPTVADHNLETSATKETAPSLLQRQTAGQEQLVRCRLTAALLACDFKSVMHPGRLNDVISAVDIYCQQIASLSSAQQDSRIPELRKWSEAIRNAGETIKIADEAISVIETHAIRLSAELNREPLPSAPRSTFEPPFCAQASFAAIRVPHERGSPQSFTTHGSSPDTYCTGLGERGGRSANDEPEWDTFLA